MPMYEYKCDGCGHGFERYAAGKGGSETAEKCPVCRKGTMKKVFSTFSSSCCGGGGVSAAGAGGCGGGSSHFT